MEKTSFDWDDLRYVLAVSRGGSLSAAARRLGVNHSTVFRRLNGLEARLDVRLFDRLAEGYRLTAAGSDLAASAERVEAEMLALDHRLAGDDSGLRGSLRLTAPDDLAEAVVLPLVTRFMANYPEIALEVVIENRMLSLTRREADVALRPTLDPPETLVGRRVSGLAWAVYGAAAINPAKVDGIVSLTDRRWIGWDEGTGSPLLTRLMARQLPARAIVYRSNSLLNQLAACRRGIGLALLPCFLGDPDPQLDRVVPPDPAWDGALWLLTHPDLRHTARVRALLDFLFEELRPARGLFEGEGRSRSA